MAIIYIETIKRLAKQYGWFLIFVVSTVVLSTYFIMAHEPSGVSVTKHFVAMMFFGGLLSGIMTAILWVCVAIISTVMSFWDQEVEKTKKIWEQKLEEL